MIYGFIGGGRMGSSLIRALLDNKLVDGQDITVSDLIDERVAELGGLGVATIEDNVSLAAKSDVIFLCIKPQSIEGVLEEIKGGCSDKIIVSIVAGVTIGFIENFISTARVIRVMPNTPALVGELAAGYCLGKNASEEDGELVGELLKGLGVAVRVDENLMDAVTGLSGSGPAYVYYVIDALSKAGVNLGLSEEDSLKLSAKTVKGAAEMVLSTGKTPTELIDIVCSPGGTTIEGMKVLEKSDLTKILYHAVKAATEKSQSLSK